MAELLSTVFAGKILALADKGFLGTGKQLADELVLGVSTQSDCFSDKEIKETVGELRDLQTALESRGVIVCFRPKSNGNAPNQYH